VRQTDARQPLIDGSEENTVTAPINLKLQAPTIHIPGWQQQAKEWMALNAAVQGNPDFYPLTVKGAYVIGVEHDICESVTRLLAHPSAKTTTYIPAYGVFASGIELLGRCINGNASTRGSVGDLKTGFKWLVTNSYDSVPDNHVLITTSAGSHTIDSLTALRHFAAHGQGTANMAGAGASQSGNIDFEILSRMPPLIADGLERYWNQLQRDDNLCNKLAQANVIALRNWPVLRSWSLFERDASGKYHSITEIFNRFDWRV
jgi:hypothetical protein